jgi:hypothetical protein
VDVLSMKNTDQNEGLVEHVCGLSGNLVAKDRQ